MANTQSDSDNKGTKGNFANDPERASEAGKKGGQHSHGGSDSANKGGNFDKDSAKASEAGKKGGEHSHSSKG